MTPRRWLVLASSVALIYAGTLLSAYLAGGHVLPAQLNSVILTAIAVGFLQASMLDRATRTDRRLDERLDRHLREATAAHGDQIETLLEVSAAFTLDATRLERVLDRTGHLQARTAVMVEGLRDTAQDRRADVAAHARCDKLADSLEDLNERIDRVEKSSAPAVRAINSVRGTRP